jgi:fructokinase
VSMWVCGEVLIDLMPAATVVGGGPANTARALARLGHDVEFIDGISRDDYGKSARAELLGDGVKLTYCLDSNKPTCTARIALDITGRASYDFTIEGTSTFDFSESWLPDPSRYKPSVLHIGTLATIVEPGSLALYEWAMKTAEFAPIVFDPNIRPSVMGSRDRYQAVVEKWVGISTVVKVSEDDLDWLYPNIALLEVAKRWVVEGVALVVITRGAAGLAAITADEVVEVAGVDVQVVDTVGAGDTVGAIVAEAMVEQGMMNLHGKTLQEMLNCAAAAAAITCSHAGGQPPTKSEIQTALKRRV